MVWAKFIITPDERHPDESHIVIFSDVYKAKRTPQESVLGASYDHLSATIGSRVFEYVPTTDSVVALDSGQFSAIKLNNMTFHTVPAGNIPSETISFYYDDDSNHLKSKPLVSIEGIPRVYFDFTSNELEIKIGDGTFKAYQSWRDYEFTPPLPDWLRYDAHYGANLALDIDNTNRTTYRDDFVGPVPSEMTRDINPPMPPDDVISQPISLIPDSNRVRVVMLPSGKVATFRESENNIERDAREYFRWNYNTGLLETAPLNNPNSWRSASKYLYVQILDKNGNWIYYDPEDLGRNLWAENLTHPRDIDTRDSSPSTVNANTNVPNINTVKDDIEADSSNGKVSLEPSSVGGNKNVIDPPAKQSTDELDKVLVWVTDDVILPDGHKKPTGTPYVITRGEDLPALGGYLRYDWNSHTVYAMNSALYGDLLWHDVESESAAGRKIIIVENPSAGQLNASKEGYDAFITFEKLLPTADKEVIERTIQEATADETSDMTVGLIVAGVALVAVVGLLAMGGKKKKKSD